MSDPHKNIVPHITDEPVVGPVSVSDAPKEIADVLDWTKIVEVKNIDKLDFLETITADAHYKETVEPYNKRAQKVVEYAIGEAVDNIVKHSLKDANVPEPASKLSVLKADHPEYEEVKIVTENFFDKKEINETGGGIHKFIERIDTINKKSVEELDAEYLQELDRGVDSINTHGWGNLGFLDMARKIKKLYKDKITNIFKAIITPINTHIAKLTMVIRIPIPKTA